jgi:hypothetical protein
VGDGVNSGYRRAKGSVGQWARSGQGAYKSTRDKVVKGAKGTSQYVREVADAVSRKAHRQGDAAIFANVFGLLTGSESDSNLERRSEPRHRAHRHKRTNGLKGRYLDSCACDPRYVVGSHSITLFTA